MNIENIWKKYQAAIKAFLHSRISNFDDVDDLLQDISIKAYKNIHTVKSERSIKSWLFQIANHTVIDFHRRKNNLYEINVEDLWFHKDNVDAIQALSCCVEPFIMDLPQEIAEMLIAIDIQGQSQKDYANHLGMNYSTVKSRVQKGGRQLRKLFEDCCHLSFDRHGNLIDFEPKSNDCKQC